MNYSEMKEKFFLALKNVNEAQDIVNEIREKVPIAMVWDEWDDLADELETVRADMVHIKREFERVGI